MNHDPKNLQGVLESALAGVSSFEVTYRPMFGGILAYADGRPFASLWDQGIAFKLSPDDQKELLSHDGACMLKYSPTEPPSKLYVQVPESFLRDPGALASWAEKSAGYVRSLPAKKKRVNPDAGGR